MADYQLVKMLGLDPMVKRVLYQQGCFVGGTVLRVARDLAENSVHIHRDMPIIIAKNIENTLVKAFALVGIEDWNSIFWVAHPGGQAILDMVEAKVSLDKKRLRTCRHVLSVHPRRDEETLH